MPSTRKPLPNDRKKVTASARAKTSVKKTGSRKASHLDGSYLEKLAGKKTVSTAKSDQPGPSGPSNNDAILSMLQEIKDSNTAPAHRMDRVGQTAAGGGTPLNLRSHAHAIPTHPSQMGSPVLNSNQGDVAINAMGPSNGPEPSQIHDPPISRHQYQLQHNYPGIQQPGAPQLPQTHMQDHLQAFNQHDPRDVVIPSLQTLRTNPTVSDAVNNLLASYEVRTHSDLAQGKPNSSRRSGRYNTHDLVTAQPQLRWPNEGFQASGGKKRLTYNELSLPQWVAGQLTNIYAMSEPKQIKQAVLQITLAMRDAASLPWPAVRAAWASSMHQVEEGTPML